jgi:OFA family oxalate/formate antiporter-like MFS transporter
MPSFVLDVFGSMRMPVVYGAILTAWSAAGVVGPQLVAFINDHYAAHAAHYAFLCDIAVLSAGLVLASALRDGRLGASSGKQAPAPTDPGSGAST